MAPIITKDGSRFDAGKLRFNGGIPFGSRLDARMFDPPEAFTGAADEAMQGDWDALDDLELGVVTRYGSGPAPSSVAVACDEAEARLSDAALKGLSGPEYVAEVTDVLEGLRAAVAATLN